MILHLAPMSLGIVLDHAEIQEDVRAVRIQLDVQPFLGDLGAGADVFQPADAVAEDHEMVARSGQIQPLAQIHLALLAAGFVHESRGGAHPAGRIAEFVVNQH